jgi:hypothetical protein
MFRLRTATKRGLRPARRSITGIGGWTVRGRGVGQFDDVVFAGGQTTIAADAHEFVAITGRHT